MSGLVLSVTVPLVLSVTTGSSYQEPKQGVSCCSSYQIQSLNYANIESLRFLLTQGALRITFVSVAFSRSRIADLQGDRA